MAITKELIDGLLVTIQNLYLADDIPWMIGYSGGKDSTAAVQLVWLAIEQLPEADRKKQIIIMNTDTLVESPVVSKWVEKSLEAMKDESTKKNLPFVPERLTQMCIRDSNEIVHEYLLRKKGPIERMYSKIAENSTVDRDTIAQFEKEDFYVTQDLYCLLYTSRCV